MARIKNVPIRRITPTAIAFGKVNPKFDVPQLPPVAYSTMMKLVREISKEVYGPGNVRFSKRSIETFQEGANAFLCQVFKFAHALVNYRNGKRFDPRDFRLAVELLTAHDVHFITPWKEKELNRLHLHARHAAQLKRIEEAKRKYMKYAKN